MIFVDFQFEEIHLRVKDQLTFLEYKKIITLIQLKKEKKKKELVRGKRKQMHSVTLFINTHIAKLHSLKLKNNTRTRRKKQTHTLFSLFFFLLHKLKINLSFFLTTYLLDLQRRFKPQVTKLSPSDSTVLNANGFA